MAINVIHALLLGVSVVAGSPGWGPSGWRTTPDSALVVARENRLSPTLRRAHAPERSDNPYRALREIVSIRQAAATPPIANPVLWGADGNVLDIAQSGSTLFIAGSFRSVGENVGGFVPLNPEGGQLVRPFPKVAGSVHAMISDASGGWYIGGEFSGVDGKARSCLAQIRADGSVSTWNPGVSNPNGSTDPPVVTALARYGDKVFVGGAFLQIGNETHANLACVDATTGAVLQLDWNTGSVSDLAILDSTLFVSGAFTSLGGEQRGKLAALNAATGQVLPWRADVFGSVSTLLTYGDTLFVGGDFLGIGGVEQHMLAALTARSAELLPFNAHVGGIRRDFFPDPLVAGLAISGDTLYVAGSFTTIGGITQSSVAAVDAHSGAALAWMAPAIGPQYAGFPPPLCETVAVEGGTLFIGGWFESVGSESRRFLASLDRSSGVLLPWNPMPDLAVGLIKPHADIVHVGGVFSLMGTWQHRAGVAALDLISGAVKPWNPNPNGGICTAIAVKAGQVFVSGDFSSIGGDPQPRQFLAALDTLTGLATDWNPGANGVANVLRVDGETLFAGGEFTQIGGVARSYLAAINTETGSVLGWNPDPDGAVLTMDRAENTLYAGGLFQLIGGQYRPCLAAIDVGSGAALPWDPQVVPGLVDALLVDGNLIYVGGAFFQIGGQPRNAIAALNLTTGLATPWDPALVGLGTPVRVRSLALTGDNLVIGGDFGSVGGQPRHCLAALDAATGLATPWNPEPDGLVWSLHAIGEELYAGGGFTRVSSIPAIGVARFHEPNLPPPKPVSLALTALPNPTAGNTTIRFALPNSGTVDLSLFDLQGRRVLTVLDDISFEAGRYDVPVRTAGMKPGIYLCRLQTVHQVITRKLALVR